MLKCERLGGLVLMDLMLNGDSKLLLRSGSEASQVLFQPRNSAPTNLSQPSRTEKAPTV